MASWLTLAGEVQVMESYKSAQQLLEEKKEALTGLEKEYERVKATVAKLRAAQVPPSSHASSCALCPLRRCAVSLCCAGLSPSPRILLRTAHGEAARPGN